MFLAQDERQSYKINSQGARSLNSVELLASIIKPETQMGLDIARQIIEYDCGGKLRNLSNLTKAHLTAYKGIGDHTAISILAAIELGLRIENEPKTNNTQIASSQDAYDIIRQEIAGLAHEEFWILALNRANKVTAKVKISQGGFTGTVVDSKVVFSEALRNKACSIILAHNHPSGSLYPSQADIRLTKKIAKAGEVMDITVLDHIIVADGYYSFADEGKL